MQAGAKDAPESALLGWLLLLPAAALAWPGPGALLAGDPYPHLAATGIALLLALPAALALPFLAGASPRPGPRGWLTFTTLWALVALAVGFGRPDDGFEARRTLAHFTCLGVALLGGALLQARSGARGRELFMRGLVLLSLAFTAGAFGTRLAAGGHLAGVLGDTGSLSQAALPGAIVGVWFFALRRGTWRALGLAATVGTIAHASVAPVIGAGAALVVALVASATCSPFSRDHSRVRRRLGLCAAVALFALISLRGLPEESGPEEAGAQTAASTDLGGVGVRLRIWKQIPALVGSAPVLGIGPGQFQAAFPPFRDPRELEISRHGVCSELTTEVEHAHNDLLEGVAEFGLVGGALWLLFLVLVALAAFRALCAEVLLEGAAGAAALALLFNALFHAPLLFNPAAAFPGFVLFGMLLARGGTAPSTSRRMRAGVTVAALLALPVFAWPAILHGRALARKDLAAALAAVPDSAPGRLFMARVRPSGSATWEGALRVRPHSVEALEQLGVDRARLGRMVAADRALSRAVALSPTHPRILRNALRVAFIRGDLERGTALLERLQLTGCLGADWPAEVGEALVLAGDLRGGVHLLFGLALEELSPEELNANGQAVEATDPDRARALRALAHLLWARDHIDGGDPTTAIRSYRQAWNATRTAGGGAASIRLEMAAAELLAGRTPPLADLRCGSTTWLELPSWAREALTEADFAPDG